MISINRSDMLVAMLPGMATADKQRIFLAKLDATLPKGDDETTAGEELEFSAEDIVGAIDRATSCTYDIQSIFLADDDGSAIDDLENDKALSMIINEDIIQDTAYIGEVFGRCNEENGHYHALFKNSSFEGTHPVLGRVSVGVIVPDDLYWRIMDSDVVFEGYDWFGSYIDGNWFFHKTDERRSTITVTERFSFVAKIFSRNAGLLETDILQNKTAILAGLGSVGSFVAMQLVKAGVPKFILCDGDTLEIHNLSRHWLSLEHLGEYKVDAMAQEIKRVNPFAEVTTFRGLIQDAPKSLFGVVTPEEGIVIATGDNRMCAAQANAVAQQLDLPFVAIGCWVRASSGEVFTWHKETGLPTYADAFDGLISDDRDVAHRAYFGEEADATTIRFEPGIWEDITFVTEIGIKLALDMMNLHEDQYTTRVYDHLTNYTLICNTNKPELGGERATLFPTPLYITDRRHSIWLREKGDAACLTISLEPNHH